MGRVAHKEELLARIRDGAPLTLRQQLRLTLLLSFPAVLAQLSSVVMEYIDAAMVGSLGADAAASIGLVASSTWLFWGLCTASAIGFSVQVAHRIGASDRDGARSVLRQSLVAVTLFGVALLAIGTAVAGRLPVWLGGGPAIVRDATVYFRIFALSLPALQLNYLAGSMLRCSGNMLVPGLLNVGMCLLDVVFNALLIFPARRVCIAGCCLPIPGADMGVAGAALGTGLAAAVTAGAMLWYLWYRSSELRLAGTRGSFRLRRDTLRRALRIGLPMGAEHAVLCGAQILTTVIVAPLGAAAIAAHAFAVTVESLCYMPGHGIADAATTLVGQCLGAGRRELTRRFARITVGTGVVVMTVMGAVMYGLAPAMMGIITPDAAIRELGVAALRIEAFAEPMFAASIVAYGVFVGAGDTLVPCAMNLGSIWAVRLTLAALLAPTMGLQGVWVAMCVELCFRGAIFLVRLRRETWIKLPK